MKLSALAHAGTAEILRSAQRDELIVEQLQQQASDVLLQSAAKGSSFKCQLKLFAVTLLGNRLWMKYRIPTQILSKLMYYCMTTLSDIQTIGEEYTGIIQVDSTGRQLPSKWSRLVMMLLDALGPLALVRIAASVEEKLRKPSSLTLHARATLLELLGAFRSSFDFTQRLHRACFYWGGGFYHISKRISGIEYVLVRRWLKDYATQPSFKLLSLVMLLHLLIYTSIQSSTWLRSFPASIAKTESILSSVGTARGEEKASTLHHCSLCLEERKNHSATTCGHVFCWDCIAQCLQTRAQCPLCREPLEASRLIPLQNYGSVKRL